MITSVRLICALEGFDTLTTARTVLIHPYGETRLTEYLPPEFCAGDARCESCRVRDAQLAEAQRQVEEASAPSREEARAALLNFESKTVNEVSAMLRRTVELLLDAGRAPATHQLRDFPPRAPAPAKRSGLFRRRPQAPDIPLAAQPVMSTTGWLFGEGEASRILGSDGYMYRAGDWSAPTQRKSLRDWAAEAVEEAVHYYHYQSRQDESGNSFLMRGSAFEAAFAVPFNRERRRAVEAMRESIKEWRDKQVQLCVQLLTEAGVDTRQLHLTDP